jgi:hypothetical protein
MTFEVLMAVTMTNVFWDVMPCDLVEVYQRFCLENRGNRFL